MKLTHCTPERIHEFILDKKELETLSLFVPTIRDESDKIRFIMLWNRYYSVMNLRKNKTLLNLDWTEQEKKDFTSIELTHKG